MQSGDDKPAAKASLRHRLRPRRRALGPDALLDTAARLAESADERLFAGLASVAGFVAHDNEPDPRLLLERLVEAGAGLLLPRVAGAGGGPLLPRVAGAGLELVRVAALEPLVHSGPGGIAEPIGPALVLGAIALPALVLVPALALARDGRRLGRGGGHYDRLLPRLRALGWIIVGVCHEAEIEPDLPTEAHDQRVDYLLTEAGLRPVLSDSLRLASRSGELRH